MNSKNKSLLLPFYFGSVQEEERIKVERELLTDPELLLDYLDLKRKIEVAESIPTQVSNNVWLNLKYKMQAKKKFYWPMALGLVTAAVLAIWIVVDKPAKNPDQQPEVQQTSFLIDSSSELLQVNTVL